MWFLCSLQRTFCCEVILWWMIHVVVEFWSFVCLVLFWGNPQDWLRGCGVFEEFWSRTGRRYCGIAMVWDLGFCSSWVSAGAAVVCGMGVIHPERFYMGRSCGVICERLWERRVWNLTFDFKWCKFLVSVLNVPSSPVCPSYTIDTTFKRFASSSLGSLTLEIN